MLPVIGTYQEPIPGWIDNLYGPTGVVLGVGAGLIRTMCADPQRIADIVPADLLVNAIIATAWDISTKQYNGPTETTASLNTNPNPNTPTPPITNYVSSNRNPITWGQFFFWNMTFGQAYPTIHTLWYYTLIMTPYKHLNFLLNILMHFLPALLVDGACLVVGKKPTLFKVYTKINKFLRVIAYFSTQQWKIQDDRIEELWNKMDERDKALLPFRMEDLQWDVFFLNNIKTMRWCMMKDSEDSLPAARKKLARYGVFS